MEARVCCDTIESEFELIRTLGFLCNCARGLLYQRQYKMQMHELVFQHLTLKAIPTSANITAIMAPCAVK